jgi:hypothetical protein
MFLERNAMVLCLANKAVAILYLYERFCLPLGVNA